MDVLTIGGEIKLRRRYFWSKWEGGVFPADASIGIALTKASPAAREACCTMGVVQDFAQGAEDLYRLTGLRVSKERLRQITELEAAEVSARNAAGTLPSSWFAPEATVTPHGPTRVYYLVSGISYTLGHKERAHQRGVAFDGGQIGDDAGLQGFIRTQRFLGGAVLF